MVLMALGSGVGEFFISKHLIADELINLNKTLLYLFKRYCKYIASLSFT